MYQLDIVQSLRELGLFNIKYDELLFLTWSILFPTLETNQSNTLLGMQLIELIHDCKPLTNDYLVCSTLPNRYNTQEVYEEFYEATHCQYNQALTNQALCRYYLSQ